MISPPPADALQLASRWALIELELMDSSGEFRGCLIDAGDGGYETLYEAYDHCGPKVLLEPGRFSARHREALDESISAELTKVALPTPQAGTSFHGFLYEAFLTEQLKPSRIAYKRHHSAALTLRPTAPLSIERVSAMVSAIY
jgi:hypothetical protein